MKSWVYKINIQYFKPILKKPSKYISCFFAFIGSIYTLVEIENTIFKTQNLAELFKNYFIYILIGILILTLFIHREKAEYSAHLGRMDYSVKLSLGDLLKTKGSAIVIPTNTTFDTIMEDDFISSESIQGKFQNKYFKSNLSTLNNLLKASLEEKYANDYCELNDRKKSNIRRYKIGSVAKITINTTHYYFLAVADVNKKGKPENVTMQSMTQALVGLWTYLSQEGNNEPLTIPVIGTGRAGLKDGNIEDVIHETIFSFSSAAQEEFVSKGLTICIYPPSLSKANVSWESLCDYLKLQCCYATENQKRKELVQVIGKPIE